MKIQILIGILGIFSCTFGVKEGFCEQPRAMPALRDQGGAASTPGPAPSSDPQVWFAKGQAALQAGDLDSAEADFRKVTAADPRAGTAYANLGVIAMRRKEWDRALALLQKAERLEPKMAGIRLNIGLAKYRQGDYASAIAPFASVVRDEPDSQQARYLLGLCHLFTEHYTETISVLEPMWAQQSNNFMYLYVLDIAAHKTGRKDLDEKALNRLVEIGGETPEFHLILGKAYLNREEPEKALPELQRAASANPSLPYLHFSLGVAYLRLDNNAAAEAEFRKDLEVEADLPDTYEQLGEFYLRAGNNEEAAKFFREALKRNPRMPSALFGAAKIYLQQQHYREALTAINSAVRLAPDNQEVHFLRGQILARLGRREEAQSEFATSKKILNAGLTKRRESLSGNSVPNPELAQPPE
jgi:tetratricopeptide (TPR) repeat protein